MIKKEIVGDDWNWGTCWMYEICGVFLGGFFLRIGQKIAQFRLMFKNSWT